MNRRFGPPQIFAVLLLLAFIGQAVVLISRVPLSHTERAYTVSQDVEGNTFYAAHPQYEPLRSPLTTVLGQSLAPLKDNVPWLANQPPERPTWILRLPFLVCGVLLGASVWYVSRRLYGNSGGYIALALFAFSPTMITHSARVQPEILAAWGTFGCIFTGIAVAHTLYAPREVVLWNWKRILLLGVSIGVGVGSHLAVAVAVPIALALMLYLVPDRRAAAVAIIAAACGVALVLLLAITRLHLGTLATAGLAGFSPRLLITALGWRLLGAFLLHNSAGFVLLLAISLLTFAAWRHTRFFGTAAPLLVFLALLLLAIMLPHAAGLSFLVMALPFAFVFIAGIAADLLQTRQAALALGLVLAALVGHAAFSLTGLLQLR